MSDRKHTYSLILKPSLLFIVSGLFILFLFPKETKFKYEFAKGKPWQHERLIAPFSYAIDKTSSQIEWEKDSIETYHAPYFIWDETVGKKKCQSLNSTYFTDRNDSIISNFVDSVLKDCYQKYIIDPIVLERLKHKEIYVLKNKESEVVPIQNLYTPKKLFLELKIVLQDYQFRNPDLRTTVLTNSIELGNFISSNLEFNADLSQQILEQKLAKISTTTGLIQKGELIISTGEIVNETDYNILSSYRSEYQKRYTNSGSTILIFGNILIIAAPLTLLFIFLFQYRKKILLDSKKTLFILSNVLIFTSLVILNNRYHISHIYLLPITILPILIQAFFDSRLASFVYIITLLFMAYLVPNSFEFIFIQLISGNIAIFSLSQITKRSHIFKTSSIVFLTYCITYFGMAMIQESNWQTINWQYIGLFAGNALMITLSYPLVYLSEKLFGFTSDVTLLELSDTNHILLKKLSEKAPGTFQHSLQVANIAEELIRSIGGNPLLVRTGALYHDIGKLKNPAYFTENQSENFNPHNKLSCKESSQIIIQHIPDGLALAKKYNLPQAIVDFIPMHQGTLTTKFFYMTYKKDHPEENIDPIDFSYPGPKPFSKETAVVMIADSIEAASRSLKQYTPESISNLIDKIIDYQLEEKQFENVNMTFKDLNMIKQVLKEKLATIYHTRIEYPEEETMDK